MNSTMFARVRKALAARDWTAADAELKAFNKFLWKQKSNPALTPAEKAGVFALGLLGAAARHMIAVNTSPRPRVK